MTFKEKFDSEHIWHRKVLILELFHNSMRLRNVRWSQRDTASAFGVSLGLVNEDLLLARLVKEDSGIDKCKTRKEALIVMRGSH